MARNHKRRRAMLLGCALASAAFVSAPGMAQTAAARLTPLSGNVAPNWGNIRTFTGDVGPYWGNIRTFWGDANPYEGNITAFWGNIRTFNDGSTPNLISPSWGNIRTFWGDVGASWGNIRTFWGNIRTFDAAPGDYATLAGQLRDLTAKSEALFGPAITAATGQSFNDGFASTIFAKYGINLDDPRTLETLDANRREQFFMEWHDQLMQFSGADQVDHWMGEANWTPALTQTQGSGIDAVIGLVDFFVAGDADIKSKVVYSGGESAFSNGHGAAVGSLMVSSHEGKGVMGIAPGAKVAAYNPFDSTGTADWASVRRGIVEVTKRNAAVVNLSLGVPGTTFDSGWRGVFSASDVKSVKDKALYVIAAGNDGITQTKNIEMKDTFDSTYLVVGSVDPSGKISSFSNRPGTACLTEDGKCENALKGDDYFKKSGYLMNRFIVAPGELILVSDDKGGIMRASGTSFSAPLVSGAIALIHDRWPWLKNKPRAVAAMILGSARDLGAPGIDPVYGVGMLDVEASQSPLAFENMKFYLVQGTKTTEQKVSVLQDTGLKPTWETSNLFFAAFETVEGAERDFLIPLSSRLVGTQLSGQYFQDYVYDRMVSWLAGTPSLTANTRASFSDAGVRVDAPSRSGWKMAVTGRTTEPVAVAHGARRLKMETTFHFDAPSGSLGFSFGQGQGAVALGGQAGFGMRSDYDPAVGGVNPVLGFASGGAHVSARAQVAPKLSVSIGATEHSLTREHDREIFAARDRTLILGLDPYRATAANLRLDYQATKAFTLSASYTELDEAHSLLGIRSIAPGDLDGGSTTRSVTFGGDLMLAHGLSLSGSATAANTRSPDQDSAIRVSDGGLTSTSFQVTLAKARVLNGNDRLRLSVAQPLTTRAGTIDFSSIQVVDRLTGEKGIVTQTVDVTTSARPYVAEFLYGQALMGGASELSLFGRAQFGKGDLPLEQRGVMAGGRFRLGF